ncbi:MAG: hypothetical protein ACI39U_01680 [Candidatus Cryptobacteroides sp.]
MGSKSDNKFDESLRQMLSGAEEMPPERVWDRIASAMDAEPASGGTIRSSRGRVFRLAGLGLVSAAAAVAAFFLLHSPSEENVADTDLLAETPATEEVSPVHPDTSEEITAVRDDAGESRPEVGVAYGSSIREAVSETASVAESRVPETVEEAGPAGGQEPGDESGIIGTANPAKTTLLADSDVWNGPEETGSGQKPGHHSIYELCIGGNSFVGPGKKTESIRMMSQGRFKIPTSTAFVENNDTDYYYLPMSFGVGVKFRIVKWLDIGIGINYTLLAKRVCGTYYEYDASGDLVRFCSTELKNSQHYIGVPLDIYFNIFGNEKWNTYASVGGCIEKCILNHYNGTYEDVPISYNTFVEGIQTSVKVGLGVEYSPVRFLGIYLDPSLRYYFNNNQPRSIRTSQPLSFGVEAGLRFKL